MATKAPAASTESEDAPQVPAAEITLTDFCSKQSETVRRPELLSGFHRYMTKRKVERATPDAFAKAMTEFLNQPV